jgi:hypothetical protein
MEGQFCGKCGARVGAEVSGGPAPAAPETGMPPAAPPKKGKVLVWVLMGCGGLLVLALVAALSLGLFVRSKIGGTRNPEFAAVKLMVSMNPEVDVVNADENTGKITLREKKTGKTVTLDFQEIKKGRISFQDESGEKVEIRGSGEGDTGSMTIESKEGKLQLGQGSSANVPAWVPKYPGAQVAATYSAQGKDEDGGTFQLKCSGSVQQVADYYEQQLKAAGMKIEKHSMQSGSGSMIMVSGTDDASRRSVVASVTSSDGGTVASIVYSAKK